MLLLDSLQEIGGLSVYRDHSDSSSFYYLPGAPRIRLIDGKPKVSLLRYRVMGGESGGFLSLEVDLNHDEELLAAVKAELGNKYGAPINLAPVLFSEGKVRLTVLGTEQQSPGADGVDTGEAKSRRFVEEIVGVATPSLLGSQVAIFSVKLDARGATLMHDQLMGSGSTQMTVAYELHFNGLMPARGVKATVKYHMAYDYLRTRLAANSLYLKADLDREAEALAREGHIEIEDIDYTGSDPAVLAEREQQIRKTLEELAESIFFRPATVPVSAGGENQVVRAGSPQALVNGAFVLRALKQDESQILTYDYHEARVVSRVVAPQGMLNLPEGAEAEQIIKDIDPTNDPFFQFIDLSILCMPDADWSGVADMVVDVRSADEIKTETLSPQTLQHQLRFDNKALEYRVTVHFTPEEDALGSRQEISAEFAPLGGRTLILDPAVYAQRRMVTVAYGVVDPEIVKMFKVVASIDGQTRTDILNDSHKQMQFPVYGRHVVDVRAELHDKESNITELIQQIGVQDKLAILNQPANLYRTIMIQFSDPLGRYDSVDVEIKQAGEHAVRVYSLTRTQDSAVWTMPVSGQAFEYAYRINKIFRDGSNVQIDWQDSVESLLLVGDNHIRMETVEGYLLGYDDIIGGSLSLKSKNVPDDITGRQDVFLDEGMEQFVVSLPVSRAAELEYSVEGELFNLSGDIIPINQIDNRDNIVIITPE